MKRNQHFFFILLMICILFSSNSYSQESVVVSGGTATGAGGSSSYSVGQVVYKGLSGSDGYIVQGVQQPYEIVALGNEEFNNVKLEMTAYPNPTVDVLNLEITDNKWNDLSFTVLDNNGKTVAKKTKVTTSQTQLSMQRYTSGIYFLTVTDRNKPIKTFKIIKK